MGREKGDLGQSVLKRNLRIALKEYQNPSSRTYTDFRASYLDFSEDKHDQLHL